MSMKRVNAALEDFELVEVFGRPMLFTCLRVDRATVPEGYHVYEVRHDDDGDGIPCQIGKYDWYQIACQKQAETAPTPNQKKIKYLTQIICQGCFMRARMKSRKETEDE